MTDVLGEGNRSKSEILQETFRVFMLLPIRGALKQFQIGFEGRKSLFFYVDHLGCFATPALNPDKDIGVKDHNNIPPEGAPFPAIQFLRLFAY